MNRRGFLQAILALGVAPYVVTTAGVLMPVRQVITIPSLRTLNPKTDTVAGQLEGLLASDSPLITSARTRAAQSANRRGLLNSSMAVQAGEQAADVETLWIPPVACSADPCAQAGWVSAKTVVHGKEYGVCYRVLATEDGLALRDHAKRGLLTVLRDGGVLT